MGQDKFFWVLLLVLLANLTVRIYSYQGEYLSKYDPVYWEGRYLRSQWVVPDSKESIGDDGLYAYAGWEYIHGRDPTTLNAEMPPLGKYLIGLSILVFGNQNIFALICGLLVLGAFFRLNQLVFKNSFWALVPVVAFSFEPLFWQQLRAPYLDLLHLLFLFLTFNFFLRQCLFLAVLFLGLMAATKASASTFFLVGLTTILYLIFRKKWSLFARWLFLLPISLVSFVLTYLRYFWLGHSLREFLGVQKWIWQFYATGAKASVGAVWRMLLTGKWLTWWNGIVGVSEWWVGWMILLLVFIAYWLVVVFRRRTDDLFLLSLWVLIYLLFLSFIPVWPRYLLVVLPFLYNCLAWSLLWLKSIRLR